MVYWSGGGVVYRAKLLIWCSLTGARGSNPRPTVKGDNMGCNQRDYEISSEKIIERFEDWLKEYGNEQLKISEIIEAIKSWEEQQRKMAALYHSGQITAFEFDAFSMLEEEFGDINSYIMFGPHKGDRKVYYNMRPEEKYRSDKEYEELDRRISRAQTFEDLFNIGVE